MVDVSCYMHLKKRIKAMCDGLLLSVRPISTSVAFRKRII